MRNPKQIECKLCNTEFKQKNYNQKFCSDKCRNDFHNNEKAKAWERYKQEHGSYETH